MRILIFHGYLLRGTGSNIYNANLARSLARLGHEVHLFCQDRSAQAPEGVTIQVPDIGRVLPVYVADHYEGFDAVPFPELDDAALGHYVDANVAAIRSAPVPDLALGSPGFDIVTRTHVEGHAAALMQQQGITQGTLYINNPAVCTSCSALLPRMLAPGSTLNVVLPNGTVITFTGSRP